MHCGLSFEELAPRLFSFNSPYGACPACSGLGEKIEIDPWKVIPDRSKSIEDGAIVPWSKSLGGGRFPSMNPYYLQQLERVLRKYRVKMSTPIEDLSDDVVDVILYGTENEQNFAYTSRAGKTWEYRGVVRRRHQQPAAPLQRNLERLRQGRHREVHVGIDVPDLQGRAPQTRSAGGHGRRRKHRRGDADVDRKLRSFFRELELTARQEQIAHQIVKEIRARLGFLTNVGLNYLTLARSATTLSGGESQRIRLATQIGSALVGVLYILDEPSIGLHQRDNDRLLATLKTLRDLGNTLIVIEHDEDTMRTADVVVDIGPGAGAEGGEILTVGTLDEVLDNPESETGAYLSGRKFIPIPKTPPRAARAGSKCATRRPTTSTASTSTFPIGAFAPSPA